MKITREQVKFILIWECFYLCSLLILWGVACFKIDLDPFGETHLTDWNYALFFGFIPIGSGVFAMVAACRMIGRKFDSKF